VEQQLLDFTKKLASLKRRKGCEAFSWKRVQCSSLSLRVRERGEGEREFIQ